MKIVTNNGKVIDMLVQYETKIDDKWEAITRYDCAHGYFHRDIISPNGDKEKKAIAISDLEVALTYAEQDIKDRWEFYKANYIKKLRK